MNLQSPADKKTIKKLKTYFIIKNISFLITSILLIISTVFFFCLLILQDHSETLQTQIDEKQSILKDEKITSTGEAIQNLNNTISSVSQIQNKYIIWTNFLKNFTDIMPADIRIQNMQFINTTNKMQITGFADNRDNFLLFKDKLSNFSPLTNIDSPISSITQRENIDFIITGEINENIYK